MKRAKQWCLRRIKGGEVLLKDGAWTSPGNCMMREFGVVWHIPRLFSTKREGNLQRWRISATPDRVEVVEYTWALKPWERDGSIIRRAFELGDQVRA